MTLTGTVELDSMRQVFGIAVGKIEHVPGVRNQLVLSPPAIPDNILYSRVQRTLSDAGYVGISIRTHEGSVVLQGTVRNAKSLERLRQLVRLTPGVKEIECNVMVAEK